MAKLSQGDVLKLAQLARLHLSEDEVSQFAEEISAILGYVEQLGGAEVDNLEPTGQVTGLTNIMRKDEVLAKGPTPKALLENAPAIENGHIKVKRMVG